MACSQQAQAGNAFRLNGCLHSQAPGPLCSVCIAFMNAHMTLLMMLMALTATATATVIP